MSNLETTNHSPHPVLYKWDDRSLSFSENHPLDPHHHGAAELIVAFEKPFESVVKINKRVITRSLLIPPNIQHQNIHHDSICPILYLDAEGRDYRLLIRWLKNRAGIYQDLPLEARAREIFKKIYRELPTAEHCYELIQQALFDAPRPARSSLDPRIERILEITQANLSENLSLEKLAAEVGLSQDRLQHLFSEQVGIPFRKYRLWNRLKHASKLYFEGNNLTYVAHESGFADSSHYTKSFRKMFGTQPSKFLSNQRNLKVFFG